MGENLEDFKRQCDEREARLEDEHRNVEEAKKVVKDLNRELRVLEESITPAQVCCALSCGDDTFLCWYCLMLLLPISWVSLYSTF